MLPTFRGTMLRAQHCSWKSILKSAKKEFSSNSVCQTTRDSCCGNGHHTKCQGMTLDEYKSIGLAKVLP